MRSEIPFSDAQTASGSLGRRYARHIVGLGATRLGYYSAQEQNLLNLFREKVQSVWSARNGHPLTPEQLDSLTTTFNESFKASLNVLAKV